MGVSQNYKLDGYVFADEADYEQAKRELETIHNIDKKMNLGDPKVALNLYNQAISKKLFKTPVGYSFLKELRGMIVSCGLVEEEDLNMIPVGSAGGSNKGTVGKGRRRSNAVVKYSDESRQSAVTEGVDNTVIKNLYKKEKKKCTALSVAVFALVGIIIAIFIVTLQSKYSYITYFTDYENNIREEVIDKYENWEKELEAREKALDDKTK